MILLDTNVLSETMRADSNPKILKWIDKRFSNCAVSSVTIFEIEAGIRILPIGRRRTVFEDAHQKLIRRFGPRIFSFDHSAAISAAELFARARAQGYGPHQWPQNIADLQIAGIAAANGLILATRNTADFEGLGIALENPWGPLAP